MKLRVASRSPAGMNVVRFILEDRNGQSLPPFAPGDHIELTFNDENGECIRRSYSLTNTSSQDASPQFYEIGILRNEEGLGGSRWLHAHLSEGSFIEVSAPRSHFPMDDRAAHRILIAGGIGITPILSMARACDRSRLPYELHFFCRSEDDAPFIADVRALSGQSLHIHAGIEPDKVRTRLTEILRSPSSQATVHVCGPSGLIGATTETAHELAWEKHRVRFERFAPEKSATDHAFTAILGSGQTIEVGAQETLLHALQREGISVMSSCGAGNCGACLVVVLEGEVEHRDTVLSAEEKAENAVMCCCVSRAKGDSIVMEV